MGQRQGVYWLGSVPDVRWIARGRSGSLAVPENIWATQVVLPGCQECVGNRSAWLDARSRRSGNGQALLESAILAVRGCKLWTR